MIDDKTSKSGEKRDLVFTRVFDAPVERVWKAWTDSEQVMLWGPTGFTCPFARIDLREGRKSLVCMRCPGNSAARTCTPPGPTPRSRRVARSSIFTTSPTRTATASKPAALGLPPDMPSEVRNLVTFKAVAPDKTLLTVVEFDWPVGRMMELSKQGHGAVPRQDGGERRRDLGALMKRLYQFVVVKKRLSRATSCLSQNRTEKDRTIRSGISQQGSN